MIIKILEYIIVVERIDRISPVFSYRSNNYPSEYYFYYYMNGKEYKLSTKDKELTESLYNKLVDAMQIIHQSYNF